MDLYQGRVISYGNYDPSSETLFGMVGDGVLYFATVISTLTYVNGRVKKKRYLVTG